MQYRILASALAALAIALSGCSIIDGHNRVAGWPELKVVEHHVSHREMRDRCMRFVGPFMIPEGCTVFRFDRGEAHIYVSQDFPDPSVLEHERLHAAGYDHIGSDAMARMLADWKARAARADEQEAFDIVAAVHESRLQFVAQLASQE